MLQDAIETFKKKYEVYEDKLIIDDYIPVDGEYIIVDEEGDSFKILDRIHIKQDKKTKQVDTSSDYYEFICKADYMSKYLESNKAIKDKNIFSNNYLTFFVKKENIANGKISKEVIDAYYDVLKTPTLKYSKSKSRAMYEEMEKRYGAVNEKRLEMIRAWIKENVYSFVDDKSNDKTQLKIFFKYDFEEYKKESQKYFIPNIFNSTDYNENINGSIYGLPNDNMGLNTKKPYLENKTRKVTVPYLLSLDEVIIQRKFFDYLSNQLSKGKQNIYIDSKEILSFSNDEMLEDKFTGIFMRLQKGKEVEIHDFDNVVNYQHRISTINLDNILDADTKYLKMRYGSINTLKEVKNIVNEIFFSGYLVNNYFTEPKDISLIDNNLKRNLLLTRGALFTWFYKGSNNGVWNVLNRSSLSLIKGSIVKGSIPRACEQFNLRWSLKAYFEGAVHMADILMEVKNSLREKINNKEKDMVIENDREYYFAVGQLMSYFISLNKSSKKNHSLANPIINAKNDGKVKTELKKMFKKYNYTIDTVRGRFESLMASVTSYVPESDIQDDLIIAGYLHSNLIYEKTNKGDEHNEKKSIWSFRNCI